MTTNGDRLIRLKVDAVAPAQGQARHRFEQEDIAELARSIGRYGLLSPIVVRRAGDGFELIAGERRLRAVKLLGEKFIDALIRPADAREAALLTLIENLHREQLHYLEVAKGLKSLVEAHGFSQEALGRLLGMSQSGIANKLRILRLTPTVQAALTEAALSERHARTLLRLEDEKAQLSAVQKMAEAGMSVRQAEALIEDMCKHKVEPKGYRIYLRDHRMLVNAVLGVVRTLNDAGVMATSRVERHTDRVDVVVSLPIHTSSDK